MKQFDYAKVTAPKVAVHCDTKKQLKNLLKWADSVKLHWNDGNRYIYRIKNVWKRFRYETAVSLDDGKYGSKDEFKDSGYTVISYYDVKISKKDRL